MVVNSRIFLKPGTPIGKPETRIAVFVAGFPWQNATLPELQALITRLQNIADMAGRAKFDPLSEEAEPE
jgi:hypothetical protein